MKIYAIKLERWICLLKILFLVLFKFFFVYKFILSDSFSLESFKCNKRTNQHLEKIGIPDQIQQHNLIKICKNNVTFNSEIAVWSLITEDAQKYGIGSIKLLKSIKNNVKHTKFDPIILEIIENPLETQIREQIQEAGWKICMVNNIQPFEKHRMKTHSRFRDQFTKLLLWKAVEYKANYYFDSDTIVVNRLDNFLTLHTNLEATFSFKIACTQDFRNDNWVEGFNMGVFIVRPNQTEFERLILIKNDPNFHYEISMSEQGFLNVIYKNQWFNIGFINNANLALYDARKEYWLKNENEIVVIHFTMSKPWQCAWKYRHLCDKWMLLDHC